MRSSKELNIGLVKYLWSPLIVIFIKFRLLLHRNIGRVGHRVSEVSLLAWLVVEPGGLGHLHDLLIGAGGQVVLLLLSGNVVRGVVRADKPVDLWKIER